MNLSEWMEMNNLLITYETRHYVGPDGPQSQDALYCHFDKIGVGRSEQLSKYTDHFETSLWGNGNTFLEAAIDLIEDTLSAQVDGGTIGTSRQDRILIPKTLEIDLEFDYHEATR
jgi:hypothetical protein